MLKWSWMVGVGLALAVGYGVSDGYAAGLDRSLLTGSFSGAFGNVQDRHAAGLELDLGGGGPVQADFMEDGREPQNAGDKCLAFLFTHPLHGSTFKPGGLTIQFSVENTCETEVSALITLQIGDSSIGVLPIKVSKKVVLKPGSNPLSHSTSATKPGTYKLMGSVSVGGKIQSYDEVNFTVETP